MVMISMMMVMIMVVMILMRMRVVMMMMVFCLFVFFLPQSTNINTGIYNRDVAPTCRKLIAMLLCESRDTD